jgi:hypothetical protein
MARGVTGNDFAFPLASSGNRRTGQVDYVALTTGKPDKFALGDMI